MKSVKVSINELKQDYRREYCFIRDLLGRINLPTEQPESSDSEESDQSPTDYRLKAGSVRAERARSLAELHARLAAVKAQTGTFKGRKLKAKLQRKLKRKKKIQENKTQRNSLSKDHVSCSHYDKVPNKAPPKPIFNSNGNMVFSKFDFLGETASVADKKLLTKEKPNHKQVLEKLEKRKEYIKKLEESGNTEKAISISEDIKWNNVLKKSEGIKVKDDVSMLKKSIAKKEAKKKVSEKKWKDRLETVEKQKQERQKKRKENIDKRIKDKKQRKIKKAMKKGRYVPKNAL